MHKLIAFFLNRLCIFVRLQSIFCWKIISFFFFSHFWRCEFRRQTLTPGRGGWCSRPGHTSRRRASPGSGRPPESGRPSATHRRSPAELEIDCIFEFLANFWFFIAFLSFLYCLFFCPFQLKLKFIVKNLSSCYLLQKKVIIAKQKMWCSPVSASSWDGRRSAWWTNGGPEDTQGKFIFTFIVFFCLFPILICLIKINIFLFSKPFLSIHFCSFYTKKFV